MKSQMRDMVQVLLVIIGLIGVYELLTLIYIGSLTTIEAVTLFQALSICCLITGMLILSLGFLHRWE